MTLEQEINPRKRFVPSVLPWLIAAGALLLYLATLNHWVSLDNVWTTDRLTGWGWQPEGHVEPLYWLATYPLRWLPAKSIPLALNLFSMLCAVLVLMLLARSVALLPHDRTEAQRSREQGAFAMLTLRSAWLPPVLAALVCGLQLTFWESATGGSAEMLNLLLFACVIRCVLEFRIDEQQKWLSRAALLYGLGMANNWAMIAFFPVFVIVVLWIKSIGFFNLGFLKRMMLWGLAGFSLVLVMPLVQASASIGHQSFYAGLGNLIKEDLNSLRSVVLNRQTLSLQNPSLWLLGVLCLLPLLVMGVSWPAYFGDPSRLGVAIATLSLHVFQGFLLVVCIWLALDPDFSPRHNATLSQHGASGLTVYYLAALGVGYLSGYFLLVFGAKPKRPLPVHPLMALVNRLVLLAVWVLLVIAPATLVYRNLAQIRITNGPMLRDYAKLLLDGLPPKGAIVLSDYFFNLNRVPRLVLARSAAVEAGRSQDYLFLDTSALPSTEYHRLLQKRYPERLPGAFAVKGNLTVPESALRRLMTGLAQSNSICYLHPSFGYYFESFYPEPHGLVQKLLLFPTNSVLEVLPNQALRAENDAFWDSLTNSQLGPLAATLAPSDSAAGIGLLERVVHLAHLKKEMNPTAFELGQLYSRALDDWGVQEQRSGALAQAAVQFARALQVNPANTVAKVNQESNQRLVSGGAFPPGAIETKLGGSRNLQAVMNVDGPYDDPDMCSFTGSMVFFRGGLYRQSARELARAKVLAPASLPTRLWLAQADLSLGLPDQALEEASQIRAHAEMLGVTRTNEPELLAIEGPAKLARKDLPGAQAAIERSLKAYPDDPGLLAVASQVYFNRGYYSNALPLLDKRVQLTPTNLTLRAQIAQAALQTRAPDRTLREISEIRARATPNELNSTNGAGLLSLELAANLATTNLAGAENAVQKSLQTYPNNANLLRIASQTYLVNGYYSNALTWLDRRLESTPDDRDALYEKGVACVRNKNFELAIPPLTHALDLQGTNFNARLTRAEAYLGAKQLDAAQKDFEIDNEVLKGLLSKGQSSRDVEQASLRVNHGLGEVAYLKKDTNTAVKYYQLYLREAPTNSPAIKEEMETVTARLKELQPPSL